LVTFIVTVLEHPALFVNVTTLVPKATAVTSPVFETVATEVLPDVHGFELAGVPEPLNWEVVPTQRTEFPEMVGFALTVIG
jgi:hypothetical protein